MRPIIFSREKILEIFYRHKALSKDKILALSGCSTMTIWRILREHGYVTSYNFNSKFYTLRDITEFDEYGLWTYKGINFSKHGTLTETLIALIINSNSGMTADELGLILKMNVRPTLTRLCNQKKIKKEKKQRVFIYLHTESQQSKMQLTVRQKQVDESIKRIGLPEPERIIAVLVTRIQKPNLKPHQFGCLLARKGCKISTEEIEAIFVYYKLSKKKL